MFPLSRTRERETAAGRWWLLAAALWAATAWSAEDVPAPKTILDLQAYRTGSSITAVSADRRGKAELIDLNPRINAWYVLTLDWGGPQAIRTYHLENARPLAQTLALSDDFPQGIELRSGDDELRCELWGSTTGSALDGARRSGLPYAPLCDGRLYLRNAVRGTYTEIERITNFLRDNVWGGDSIVGFVRDQFFQDAYLEKATSRKDPALTEPAAANAPTRAAVAAAYAESALVSQNLAIDLEAAPAPLLQGRWYPVRGTPAVFVSVIQPQAIAADLPASGRGLAGGLDAVESAALDTLVAFDLDAFDLGFALGTDHPRVGWSERALPDMRDERLPGPDGIAGIAPLASPGMVSPALTNRTVAAFTGGFKRQHGAFRYGALAQQNSGSHYGFIEQGTVFSKLQPGLATVYVLDDGSVGMKTWARQDDALLPRIRHARQNGVAVIEYDDATGTSSPGPLVNRWGPGNWSGSADEKQRTLRAGLCLQETPERRFLIYGYFSSATPSAMARVFQAYGCRYAMHLDMNALEHTYLALYTPKAGSILVQHLHAGMTEVDKKGGDALVPRFIGFPDDRDFFYLLRRESP